MNGQVFLFTRRIGTSVGDRVLEVGSLDVNGSVRENFPTASEYVGTDMRAGKGVDLVVSAEDLPTKFPAGHFDIVVCCETLEHCEFWKESLQGMWAVLKMGGKICITTPTIEKGRHNYPSDYWRWTMGDYKRIFKDQAVLKLEDVKPRSIGVVAKKMTEELFLDIEPYKVP